MSTHTITVPDDLSGLDPDTAQTLLAQIDDHIEPLWAVRARVEQIAQAPAKAADLAAAFLTARDGTVPKVEVGADISAWPAWVQPLGAGLGVYRTGDVRQHNGKLWRSSVDNNVWKPGVSQWTDITAELSPPAATPAPWSPDTAYAAGVEVSFGGHTYRSKVPIAAGQYGAMTPDNPVLWAVWEMVA